LFGFETGNAYHVSAKHGFADFLRNCRDMTFEHSNTYLGKSLFVKRLQCHKALYLAKCHPDLKDETSEFKIILAHDK
jgi:hypothetical protein